MPGNSKLMYLIFILDFRSDLEIEIYRHFQIFSSAQDIAVIGGKHDLSEISLIIIDLKYSNVNNI